MILTELVEKYEVFLVIFPHTALAGGGSKPPAICNQFHSLSIVRTSFSLWRAPILGCISVKPRYG